jgi:phage terminase large subunit
MAADPAAPVDLNIVLSDRQADALEAMLDPHRDMARLFVLLYGGAARGGKSWLGGILGFLLSLRYPGIKGFIGRETLKDARLSVLEGTIKKISEKYSWGAWWSFDGQYNVIKFANGSTITLLELAYHPSDPKYDRFGSYEYTWGWIEEAQQCPYAAYEVLRVRIGQYLNDKYGIAPLLLLTSNPGKNWIKTKFYNPWKSGTLAIGLAFIQALATDNPYREASTDNNLDSIGDAAQRARLRDGDWEYSDDPKAVMSHELLESMRHVEFKNGPVKLAVDVARMGDDSTVIAMGRGNRIDTILERKKQPTDVTAAWIRDIIKGQNVDPANVIIDVVGLGGGVVDLLRSTKIPGWGYNVKAFSGGAKATKKGKQTEFLNMRGQSYFLLREGAEEGEYLLDLDDTEFDLLAEELTGLQYEIDERKVTVEKKKDFKKRLGRSPDRADAVTMFFSIDQVAQNKVSFRAR